jgi:hypothetical protein
MARYIDRQMPVDARRTRERLGWKPRERFDLLRRLPFLVENMRTHPLEWQRRNQAILRRERSALNLRVARLLERHEAKILEELSFLLSRSVEDSSFTRHRELAETEARWGTQVALHQLTRAISSRDVGVYLSFCRDLAERRFPDGFVPEEICAVLRALGETAVRVLLQDPEAAEMRQEIEGRVTMTTLFGCDQVEESFDEIMETQVRRQQRLRSE